jgi:hypothetical protein
MSAGARDMVAAGESLVECGKFRGDVFMLCDPWATVQTGKNP